MAEKKEEEPMATKPPAKTRLCHCTACRYVVVTEKLSPPSCPECGADSLPQER